MSGAATSPLTRDQISALIAKKAWKDEAFHQEVLANPNKVYEQHGGQPLPPGVTIKVLEDTPNTVHFVLPVKPPAAGELSDAELETVAGGTSPLIPMSVVTAMDLTAVTVKGVQAGVENGW